MCSLFVRTRSNQSHVKSLRPFLSLRRHRRHTILTRSSLVFLQKNLWLFARVRTSLLSVSHQDQLSQYRKPFGDDCHLASALLKMEIPSQTATVMLLQLLSCETCVMTKNTVKSPLATMYYNPQGLNTALVSTNTLLSNIPACPRNINLFCAMVKRQS